MPRPISNSILHLYGLIPMNRTVVLLISCLFFREIMLKRFFSDQFLEKMYNYSSLYLSRSMRRPISN